MRAKTFIEYWKSPITEVMSIHKAYDLLSRPFKPEDITELFEGWEYKSNKYFHNLTRDGILVAISETHMTVDGELSSTPKILDQFISDCTRSGIELIWKEEIVKQYFK